MKLSRDSWLAIGLLVVLVAVTVLAASRQTREEIPPPLASASAAPDGARALRLWLEQLGYDVGDEVAETFLIPDGTDLALVLEPTSLIAPGEWEALDDWVAGGGTLVVAGQGFGADLAFRHYDFSLATLAPPAAVLTVAVPLLAAPPIAGPIPANAQAYFETDRADFVSLLTAGPGPAAVSFPRDQGRVILVAAPYPLSNAGLKEAGNPALALNVIAVPAPASVWFDEWHHGARPRRTEVVGPEQWLRFTPAGRSLLYSAAVIFAAVALRGRRFGRPAPPRREITRRAPLEYITAIANLNRRAGHRAAVLRQYHHRLKRRLGRRYRLDPTLRDPEYVERLARFNPNLDEDGLRGLLKRLRAPEVTEREMIQLAAEVAVWMKET